MPPAPTAELTAGPPPRLSITLPDTAPPPSPTPHRHLGFELAACASPTCRWGDLVLLAALDDQAKTSAVEFVLDRSPTG